MDDLQQKTAEMARMMNYKLHAESLNIPLLNEFNPIEPQNAQTILYAMHEKGFVQQLVSDGPLAQGETFEQRVDLVVSNTIAFMKQNNYTSSGNGYFFVKDFSNGTFNFKIYAQDIVFGNKVVRMLNAFFLEPRFNDFYQASVSVAPLPYPTQVLKVGEFDVQNDVITRLILNMLEAMLENITYKN